MSSYRNGPELKAKVEAVNLANKTANELRPLLLKALAPFVGKKVTKGDGSLLASVAKIVEPLLPAFKADGYRTLHVYKLSSFYSLAWVVKTCVTAKNPRDGFGDIACYHETTVYVGNLSRQTLAMLIWVGEDGQLLPNFDLPCNYNADDVVRLREECGKARQAYEDAKSKCYPFGE